MKYARVFMLLIITLLPQCRAAISDTPESWYSANIISDGSFSPKPLTEIFSSESPFSSTNPIVVLSTTTENQNFESTSRPTPTSTSAVTSTSSTTSTPTITSTDSEAVVPFQTTTSVPISQPQTTQTNQPSIQTESLMTGSTLPQLPQSQSIIFQPQLPPFQPSQPLIVQSQPNPSQSQPGFLQQLVIPAQLSPKESQPQSIPAVQQPSTDSRPTGQPNPNYFVIYQQAPQSIQSFPPRSGQVIAITDSPIVSSSPPITTTKSTQAPCISTTTAQITTAQTRQPQLSTSSPLLIPQSSAQYPVLRIRMIAPSGSITNVHVNPPATTTTTRRPTTTRIRKTRRKNNYDDCVNSCGGTKQPICASPVGVTPINPDTLRGFPSICHMACHNSFRRNAYEKVVDGKCGRLRTRIRTVDSDTKLKRDDLNKALYTIVQPGQTVVEFSPLTS